LAKAFFKTYKMQEKFEIEVENKRLTIEPILEDNSSKFNVYEAAQLLFKVECCSDKVGDTLKVSPEFQNKGIDSKFAEAVIDIIQSEEE
jgi:hypothetical protein